MKSFRKRAHLDHPNCRGKLADVITSTLASCISKIERIPNEVLSQILVDYMQDYFLIPRELGRQLPPALCVCRRWREIALHNPLCWTRLSIKFDGGHCVGYASHDIVSRKTQGRAAQDDLIRYFTLARGQPIDVYFIFSHSPSLAATSGLNHWLGKNLPPLRSFRSSPSFSTLWFGAPKDSLANLTYLRTPGVASGALEVPPLPNLRYVHISGSPWNILAHMNAPKLQGILAVQGAMPKDHQTASVLKRFPALIEFGIRLISDHDRQNSEDEVTCTIEHSNIRRIHLLEQERSAGLALLRGIAAQKYFPLLTELVLEDRCMNMILSSEVSADWVLECITSLSVIGDGSCYEAKHRIITPGFRRFWSWFPNLINLTFGAYHTYHTDSDNHFPFDSYEGAFGVIAAFPFEEDLGLCGQRAPTTRSPVIQELLFSLAPEPGVGLRLGSSPRLVKLKSLCLQQVELNTRIFTHLIDFLRIRQPKEDTGLVCNSELKECLLTITGSWFSPETKHMRRSPFEIDEMGFEEFKGVVDGLKDFDASRGNH